MTAKSILDGKLVYYDEDAKEWKEAKTTVKYGIIERVKRFLKGEKK
jgi:hypothetical protein